MNHTAAGNNFNNNITSNQIFDTNRLNPNPSTTTPPILIPRMATLEYDRTSLTSSTSSSSSSSPCSLSSTPGSTWKKAQFQTMGINGDTLMASCHLNNNNINNTNNNNNNNNENQRSLEMGQPFTSSDQILNHQYSTEAEKQLHEEQSSHIEQLHEYDLQLEYLPVEILTTICKFLDVKCIKCLFLVNRFFKEMADDEDVWKHLFFDRFGPKNIKLPKLHLSWKSFYRSHKTYKGRWDTIKKGKMVLSNNERTVTHGGDYLGSYQSVRGSERIELDSGCTYWEVYVESLNFNQTGFHLVIGVIPESFPVWQSYLTSNGGWGYLADGRKANNSGNGVPFAKPFAQGDRVGLLVDMNQHTLSYYLNGVVQGVAFKNLEQPVYPGVSLLTGGQSVSFIEDPSFPRLYQ
ncbi:hypothetical protein DFA_04418 [Cavenderia fasciculata]|uniref:F-box domain-containing protein n=1 Tax=Cavenderia fasciculata TaxID=261658 RepID=F4PPI7_CACFS|nr:uncharacterized protein DFA_04418 [Cavenderia fasciculata]EGG22300.1 hypothetical protein DFA_04418 [Cavenderia fasciculata]|eukprot:XP_004360151.1 hypothetical protein DFA_04418 [Cavenderia fasciculata]